MVRFACQFVLERMELIAKVREKWKEIVNVTTSAVALAQFSVVTSAAAAVIVVAMIPASNSDVVEML